MSKIKGLGAIKITHQVKAMQINQSRHCLRFQVALGPSKQRYAKPAPCPPSLLPEAKLSLVASCRCRRAFSKCNFLKKNHLNSNFKLRIIARRLRKKEKNWWQMVGSSWKRTTLFKLAPLILLPLPSKNQPQQKSSVRRHKPPLFRTNSCHQPRPSWRGVWGRRILRRGWRARRRLVMVEQRRVQESEVTIRQAECWQMARSWRWEAKAARGREGR